MSRSGKRILAPTPHAGAEPGPTLGAVKSLLHQYSHSSGVGGEALNATNLRAAYELICEIARKYGIDPQLALQQYRASKQARPRLVRRAKTRTARTQAG
ncbi:MAG TPA: hypothetical protein VMI92_04595 [Steroidobacteraceae bacterium]|nr:hypothetical protein [Steroidobacteraceae bacterium]